MQIHNTVDSIQSGILQIDPFSDSSEIVANMRAAGRLNAGKNASWPGFRLVASKITLLKLNRMSIMIKRKGLFTWDAKLRVKILDTFLTADIL